MTGRLAAKTAVITGGCSGIGRATARRFAEEGANVVLADIDDGRGRDLAADLDALFVRTDVTDKAQVDALYAAANETYGSVDIAFNNAGISPPEDGSILDVDLDTWRRVQEVNVTSVYLCCKAVLPYMLERQRGSIINNASVVAVRGATDQISYSAAKGGVLSMSRELAVQFARDGIRVNALCPGPVNTPLLQEYLAAEPEHAAHRLMRVPMGRFGAPEEIANAVLFLASDESSFVTASTFMVDGGISGAFVGPVPRRADRDRPRTGGRPPTGIEDAAGQLGLCPRVREKWMGPRWKESHTCTCPRGLPGELLRLHRWKEFWRGQACAPTRRTGCVRGSPLVS